LQYLAAILTRYILAVHRKRNAYLSTKTRFAKSLGSLVGCTFSASPHAKSTPIHFAIPARTIGGECNFVVPHSLLAQLNPFIVGWKYRKQEDEGTLVAQQDDFSMTNEGIERKMLGSRSQCVELPGWFASKIFGSR